MYDINETGPVPTDLGTRIEFNKVLVPLVQVFDAAMVSGTPGINGRRFVDCIIRGPAVILPNPGTRFINSNMGDVAGDVNNLFLKAVGPRIIGGVPVNDCIFEGCLFFAVGFGGNEEFVNAFAKSLAPGKA